MDNEQGVAQLRKIINEAPQDSIVFFGGAGVSTESGIPDFRSPNGLYSMKYKIPPEDLLSHRFFEKYPREFYDFYFNQVMWLDTQPNRAHLKLAELERQGKLKAVITQNIDGLHQKAGNTKVFELHGSIMRNYCISCKHQVTVQEMLDARERSLAEDGDGIPCCPKCGMQLRPDVVLFDEGLDMDTLKRAAEAIAEAKIFIVAGTSLMVQPATNLTTCFEGDTFAIVNKTPTHKDEFADIVIRDSIGAVLDF